MESNDDSEMLTKEMNIPGQSEIEDGEKQKCDRHKGCNLDLPKRYIFSAMGLAGCFLHSFQFSNLSVAIVAMVNSTTSSNNKSLSNDCPPSDEVQQGVSEGGGILWSSKEVGLILGSVFCGCLVSKFFGVSLAKRFRSKRVLGLSMALGSLLTLLTPVSAEWGAYALLMLRVLLGLALGPFLPAQNFMIDQWFPTTERRFHSNLIFGGLLVSSVVSPILSAVFCNSSGARGWPMAFYIPGLAGIVWTVFWLIFIHETPVQHPHISPHELQHILSNLERNAANKKSAISWKKITKSADFWSHLAVHLAVAWNAGFFATIQPWYLGKMLQMPIVKNGFVSALPNAVVLALQLLFTCPMIRDWRKKCTSITIIRILWIAAGAMTAVLSHLGLTLVGCNEAYATLFLALSFILNGMVSTAQRTLSADIATGISEPIADVLEAIGVTSMFFLPTILGILIESEQNLNQWRKMFYVNMAVIGVGASAFVFFSSFGGQKPKGTEQQEQRHIDGGILNPETLPREQITQ